MIKSESKETDSYNQVCCDDENIETALTQSTTKKAIDEILEKSMRTIYTHNSDKNAKNLVGECIDARHPTLAGRVLVKWTDSAGREYEQWVPTLQNLPVRAKDRVLLVKPGNWDEMVVTGVIDGFSRRPEIKRKTGSLLELARDEAIRVTGSDGQELMEIFQTDSGPVVRLLHKDVDVELPGRLRLQADSIDLEAGAGPINIKATDDVCINGEMIHLN